MIPESESRSVRRRGFWSTRLSLVLAAGWTLLIWALLSIPGSSLPSSQVWSYDKVGHAGLFFILSLLWLNAVRGKSTRIISGIVIAGILLGPVSEWYQSILPIGRVADPFDAVADFVGFALGTGLWLIVAGLKPPKD
jgi:VanZ family protein